MIKPVVLLLATFAGCGYMLTYGPCPNYTLQTAAVDLSTWDRNLYIVLVTSNYNAKCMWVNRTVVYNGSEAYLGDTFWRYEKGVFYNSTVRGKYVEKGHYTFEAEKIAGHVTLFHAYFMIYDPPRLMCHLVCTNDSLFANQTGSFYCEHNLPDAPKIYAPEIKAMMIRNRFNPYDLMVTENCNCPNIPYPNGPSRCQNTSIEEFFGTDDCNCSISK